MRQKHCAWFSPLISCCQSFDVILSLHFLQILTLLYCFRHTRRESLYTPYTSFIFHTQFLRTCLRWIVYLLVWEQAKVVWMPDYFITSRRSLMTEQILSLYGSTSDIEFFTWSSNNSGTSTIYKRTIISICSNTNTSFKVTYEFLSGSTRKIILEHTKAYKILKMLKRSDVVSPNRELERNRVWNVIDKTSTTLHNTKLAKIATEYTNDKSSNFRAVWDKFWMCWYFLRINSMMRRSLIWQWCIDRDVTACQKKPCLLVYTHTRKHVKLLHIQCLMCSGYTYAYKPAKYVEVAGSIPTYHSCDWPSCVELCMQLFGCARSSIMCRACIDRSSLSRRLMGQV